MKNKSPSFIPLFDTIIELSNQQLPENISMQFAWKDFQLMKNFLIHYAGSADTFNTYRRELERLAQWAWFKANKSILSLKRDDIETYIRFCQRPDKSWIGTKKVARFITQEGKRDPNPEWRIFVAVLNKSARKTDRPISIDDYEFSQKSLQSLFIALSSFYNHLIRENLTDINPISHIRQRSRYIRSRQKHRQIRRLTTLQWKCVFNTTKALAEKKPQRYERSLFILSALYLMYLRASELTVSERWEPTMNNFYQDSQQRWWFKTVGKGNKERDIVVSESMLGALKRYREYLELSPLPSPADNSPLIPKLKGKGGISNTKEIRRIIQECFDLASKKLINEGQQEEAEQLNEATVHWLRHTGISDDINKLGRPASHVRDDAGHSSSSTTDIYNDVELAARHASANKKSLE